MAMPMMQRIFGIKNYRFQSNGKQIRNQVKRHYNYRPNSVISQVPCPNFVKIYEKTLTFGSVSAKLRVRLFICLNNSRHLT